MMQHRDGETLSRRHTIQNPKSLTLNRKSLQRQIDGAAPRRRSLLEQEHDKPVSDDGKGRGRDSRELFEAESKVDHAQRRVTLSGDDVKTDDGGARGYSLIGTRAVPGGGELEEELVERMDGASSTSREGRKGGLERAESDGSMESASTVTIDEKKMADGTHLKLEILNLCTKHWDRNPS